MVNKARLEKIESRGGRPNARPIRATSGEVPEVLAQTIDSVDPHGSGVLIWLRQTHSARNAWKAFGHLFRRNAPARGSAG